MVTAVPAFLTIVIQPFTFSIANGIYAGLVMSLLLYILTGSFMNLFRRQQDPDDKEGFSGDLETHLLPDAVTAVHGHVNGHYQQQEPLYYPPIPAAVSSVPIETGSFRRRSLSRADGHHVPGSHGSYQRGSFTMYINTFGSQQSPGRALLRSQQGDSEDPEH